MLSAAVLAALFTGCAELPEVGFTFEPAEVNQYEEVTFSNTSTGADTYAWDFGDGSTSTDENPTHMFKSSGTFTVSLVATNEDGDSETEQTIEVGDAVNMYTLTGTFTHNDVSYDFDNTEFHMDSEMFWYASGMGGDPYLRLFTEVDGQDNPDLLKLYPNKGVNELPGTYTWDSGNPAGTYDAGYSANNAGMGYDWTAIGKTGSGELVITEVDTDIYTVIGEFVLSCGDYDWGGDFSFIESGTVNLSLHYTGAILPL